MRDIMGLMSKAKEMQDKMQAEIAANIRARLLQLATKKRN